MARPTFHGAITPPPTGQMDPSLSDPATGLSERDSSVRSFVSCLLYVRSSCLLEGSGFLQLHRYPTSLASSPTADVLLCVQETGLGRPHIAIRRLSPSESSSFRAFFFSCSGGGGGKRKATTSAVRMTTTTTGASVDRWIRTRGTTSYSRTFEF